MRGSGTLIVKVEFNSKFVHTANITIPQLGIDQRISKFLRIDRATAGNYSGTLTLQRVSGAEFKKTFTVRISPDQDNIHEFDLNQFTDEIYLRPVNALNRTVLRCEIKVERVDTNFRLVREERGLAYRLSPGHYTVKVILPDLKVRTVALQILEQKMDYALTVDVEAVSTRKEPRYMMSVPVVYRTSGGQWVSTSSTNMSASGICVLKGIRRISEKELVVRLFVPIAKGPLECSAKVQWIRDDRTRNSRMGLKLVLPDQTRNSLSKWLEQSSGGIFA